jgi:hypothetical protein
MNKQQENTNTQTEQKEKQDHYQKYRGNSLLILEELEHSGGRTMRSISDALLGNARVISTTIQRLLHRCLIDRVENWGYKINCNGLKVLSIFNKKDITYNNKNNNISTTTTTQDVNMKKVSVTETPMENIPSCFKRAYCHIRRLLHSDRYNTETSKLCSSNTAQCVHFNLDNFSSRQAVKISI